MAGAAGVAAANRVHPQLLRELAAKVVAIHLWVIPAAGMLSLPPVAATRRQFLGAAGMSLVAGLSAAQRGASDRPNVVLIVVDTLRTDHSYGDRARTPNIDALARRGLSFTRCYPEAMPTIPARRSIFTGRRAFPFTGWRPWGGMVQEPGWEPIADPALTFTSMLRRAGYWTGCVSDNPFVGFARSYAPFRQSFDRFVGKPGQAGGTGAGVSETELRRWLPPEVDDPETRLRMRRFLGNSRYFEDESSSYAAKVFREGSAMLEVAAGRRPFALVLDTFEPHEPWTPPRKYVDMYGDPDYRGPEPAKPYYAAVSRYLHGSSGEVLLDRMKALYAAEVTMTDRWLGVFLDKLESMRLERDTIVVLVSDHGIYLGDHGMTGKSSITLHPPLIRVPLILVDPRGRHAGRTSSWFASTHDIAPTILAMTGLPVPRKMDGVDLSRLFEGERLPPRPYAWGGYGNSYFIRTDRWALHGPNRGDLFHLYDRREDPGETRDAAGAYPGKVAELNGEVRRRAGRPLPTHPF
jgi:arylsulfatase A-like enzyme